MSEVLELLERVDIVEGDAEQGIVVHAIWKNVDRPCVGGWSLPLGARPLAERLKRAIEAGAIHGRASIETDANGNTYVATTQVRVSGRTMDSDLKRLGY
jgi:hypothetical protein